MRFYRAINRTMPGPGRFAADVEYVGTEAHWFNAYAVAASAFVTPSPENESGVTLTMPMT